MLTLSHPLILASASPRRKEIMKMVGLDFEVMPSDYEEPRHSHHLLEPITFATEVTLGKGQEVFNRTKRKNIVLAADTIGILGKEVLEKPQDEKDAQRMLELMSGKEHQVLTVVAIFHPALDKPKVSEVTTSVRFRKIEKEELEHYLKTANYLDKAAAYAIQGEAAIFVEKIEGDYFNVVGLPIFTVWKMLQELTTIK